MNSIISIYKFHLSDFKRSLKKELIKEMEFYLRSEDLKTYQDLYDLTREIMNIIEDLEVKIDFFEKIRNKKLIKT
jgi:predicted house-cleaning noncanonical NTP pyrophosphatase (MazG superfamily)